MGHYYSEMNFDPPTIELPTCDECGEDVLMVIKINRGLRHTELSTSKIEYMWCWDCINTANSA